MIKILCEQPYRESLWCQEILAGLVQAMKKKRLQFTEINHMSEIQAEDELFILGSNHVWLNNVICCCNQLHLTPILLSNRLEGTLKGQYHSVYTDIKGSMVQLVSMLQDSGRERIALYGVNNTSVSDISRQQSFSEAVGGNGAVFFNDGSFDQCFASFLPHLQDFDAVICVNGLVAVSLTKKLMQVNPAILDTLCIVSCSKNFLDSIYANYIVSVDTNYTKLGTAALLIAESVKKNPYISNMNLTLAWEIDETLFAKGTATQTDKLQIPHHSFYEDAEASRMLKLDTLLDGCNETDFKILQLLLHHTPYREIADACFMSESNVKYRIKKYLEATQIASKAELIHLLQLYYN